MLFVNSRLHPSPQTMLDGSVRLIAELQMVCSALPSVSISLALGVSSKLIFSSPELYCGTLNSRRQHAYTFIIGLKLYL